MMRHALLVLPFLYMPFPGSAFEFPWAEEAEATVQTSPRPVVSVILQDIPSQRRSFPGVVVAGTEVQLGFQTLGRLAARPVDVGDRVKMGDVLAELKPDDLRANVRAAQSAVEAAEVTLETARSEAERTRDLASRNVSSRAVLEQAERRLKAAEAGMAQARSELARAEDAAGFARLVAPFDGVVSAVFENAGAVVGAGTPVLTLSDVATREAIIDLPAPALSALPVGTAMSIWLESDPATRCPGRITRIEPVADAATRTRRVHVAMENAEDFRLNALIRAQYAGDAGTILTVPPSAIAGSEDDSYVWVVNRQGDRANVSRRNVVTGARMDDIVEIAEGIQPGEEIIIRGVHSLEDGQVVGRRVAP
ncbi:efflux RND transporter periplasmic adaptor subunit [Paracoccus aerodenitrificans]|uniref:efflux RND transporter periplasmic adaptor subunit n=1 Tax=Paracoccus aerodenitrificans TaxID=3017781 RepID=UPI0022F0C675|nr:efflux RND transporter periplasmic adaptor subunit [Paracoccus aerodenitrificans]WBU63980.1 efflux RND transporter periplasmic adaptor subunit [Paracoccus aerodenitrificans]